MRVNLDVRSSNDLQVAERGGFSPATENKPLTSIDPDFSIKNETIFDPKCNRKCNQPSGTIARDRIGLHSFGLRQTRKPKPLVKT